MNFDIIKILQRDNIWKQVCSNDYEIKMLELKKRKPRLHLVYNGDITYKVIYKCQLCNKEVETDWGRFVNCQINKHKCLCRECTMGLTEIREKVSIGTKNAMDNEDLRIHLSNMQQQRWERPGTREERSKISKEVIQKIKNGEYNHRNNNIQSISYNDISINDLDINTYKVDLLTSQEISKTKSYDHEKVSNAAKKSYEEIYDNEEKQIRKINGTRKKLIKRRSAIQQMITNYLLNIKNIQIEEEYPINLYNYNFPYKYLFIDIFLEKYNIAIEILGNYWHRTFIEYNNIQDEDLKNNYILNLSQKNYEQYKVLQKEIWRDNYLRNKLKYNIFYITEHDILYENWMKKLNQYLIEKGVIR